MLDRVAQRRGMPRVVRYTQRTRMARLAVDPEPGDSSNK